MCTDKLFKLFESHIPYTENFNSGLNEIIFQVQLLPDTVSVTVICYRGGYYFSAT